MKRSLATAIATMILVVFTAAPARADVVPANVQRYLDALYAVRTSGANPHPLAPPVVVAALDAAFGDLGPRVIDCMTGIAWGETRFQWWENGQGGAHVGLLQIGASTFRYWNGKPGWPNRNNTLDAHNAADNALVGRWMFNAFAARGQSGFSPWVSSTRRNCR